MVYKMQLATEYFNKIRNGTKTIECRLYDEKRELLKVGDAIEFTNTENEEEKIKSEIVALHNFPNFSELLDYFPITILGGENKEQFLSILKKFYSNEDEKKYGVVGIEIKLI
ncbi:MAG TPA: ASCH domain-containing protein [Patescibacteria group bacterium]